MLKILIGLVIAGLVAVGGYNVVKTRQAANTELNTEVIGEANSEANVEADSQDGKKMAFSAFIKQGGSYKCEVKQAMSDFDNTGTVYVANGKIRGEFSTVAEGRTMSTMMIMKDGYAYTWSSAMPNSGFKAKIMTEVDAGTSQDYQWSADSVGDYSCEAWTADNSKFEVPANITFQAIGA